MEEEESEMSSKFEKAIKKRGLSFKGTIKKAKTIGDLKKLTNRFGLNKALKGGKN